MSLRAPAKTHRRNEMQRDRQAIKATATDDRLIARQAARIKTNQAGYGRCSELRGGPV